MSQVDGRQRAEGSLDPIALRVAAARLQAICEEAGAVLVRAAYSTNIKERHDASTAVFDARGKLAMQAAHIPVHLGSMPDSVARVAEFDVKPGEVWALNDPFRGGTHLPDITVVSPVFIAERLTAFVANRAHHADVGGMTPGSMPSDSRDVYQEGLIIPPVRIVRDGEGVADLMEVVLSNMRDRPKRTADLRAQLAANTVAAGRLTEWSRSGGGPDAITRAIDAVNDYAEQRARAAIESMPNGTWSASDYLEEDLDEQPSDRVIRAELTIDGSDLTVDFSGTDGASRGNLNCPFSVTKAAAYYVVRVMADPDMPASSGAWRPVTVRAEEGSLVNTLPPSAVVGGNVETSSRIADVLFQAFAKAIPAPASGQGTMNNVSLGNRAFTYYETIGGGQGGCPEGPGPSGIHVAMSNTLNTPIEALELEYPLRVRKYGIRRDSGGAGRHRGGDGLIRELEALEDMTYSIISERRRRPPPGERGGSPGSTGRNTLNGRPLPSKSSGEFHKNDVLRIETPGGGGWGSPARDS